MLSQRVASGQVDLSRLSERWLRPTFEAAFHAVWVLDPEESLERRRRALRVEWLDELDHRRYYDEVMQMRSAAGDADWQEARRHLAQRKDTNEASYRSDAEALHLPWPPANINIRDELGRLSHCAGLPDSDVLLRSAWRALSGHQHGRASAMLRGSDKSDGHEVPGGAYAVLSINDDAFLTAADVTLNMHIEAVALLLKRSQTRTRHQPWARGTPD